ncbi:MAG: helix-turn-helix domain-containing protein [Candidatus Verstraetearchaeota archaeon]|nr:helix-turn-helix domain-containing protein [Candidatus Verstraetearchaeota archaeon]
MKPLSVGLVGNILRVLEEAGFVASEVDSSDYCLQIVAKKGNLKLLIKSSENIDSERRCSTEDLKSLACAFNAYPFIIGVRMQRGVLEEDALYERFGVSVMHPKTFRDAVLERRFPTAYSKRGGLYFKIDGKALKSCREKKRMSLGQLASLIGVSRKAIYEYEREQMGATLQTVERLQKILGDSVISSIDIFDWHMEEEAPERNPTGIIAKQLHAKLKKIGCKAMGFSYAPIDIHAKNVGVSFLTSEEKINEEQLERKIENAVGVGRVLGSPPVLVTEDRVPNNADIIVVRIEEIKKVEKVGDLVKLLGVEITDQEN